MKLIDFELRMVDDTPYIYNSRGEKVTMGKRVGMLSVEFGIADRVISHTIRSLSDAKVMTDIIQNLLMFHVFSVDEWGLALCSDYARCEAKNLRTDFMPRPYYSWQEHTESGYMVDDEPFMECLYLFVEYDDDDNRLILHSCNDSIISVCCTYRKYRVVERQWVYVDSNFNKVCRVERATMDALYAINPTNTHSVYWNAVRRGMLAIALLDTHYVYQHAVMLRNIDEEIIIKSVIIPSAYGREYVYELYGSGTLRIKNSELERTNYTITVIEPTPMMDDIWRMYCSPDVTNREIAMKLYHSGCWKE